MSFVDGAEFFYVIAAKQKIKIFGLLQITRESTFSLTVLLVLGQHRGKVRTHYSGTWTTTHRDAPVLAEQSHCICNFLKLMHAVLDF